MNEFTSKQVYKVYVLISLLVYKFASLLVNL